MNVKEQLQTAVKEWLTIDEQLSKLAPKFSQNTLNSTNEYTYFTILIFNT